jgi:hypothetical protein
MRTVFVQPGGVLALGVQASAVTSTPLRPPAWPSSVVNTLISFVLLSTAAWASTTPVP